MVEDLFSGLLEGLAEGLVEVVGEFLGEALGGIGDAFSGGQHRGHERGPVEKYDFLPGNLDDRVPPPGGASGGRVS